MNKPIKEMIQITVDKIKLTPIEIEGIKSDYKLGLLLGVAAGFEAGIETAIEMAKTANKEK